VILQPIQELLFFVAKSKSDCLDANKSMDMGKINSVYPIVPKLVGTIDGHSIFYS